MGKFGPVNERLIRSQFRPSKFPEEVLKCGGIIGRVMDYTLSVARHPNKVLAFSGALALMSFVCGRRYKTDGNTWPNLYIVAVGRSGIGKEAARSTNMDMAKRIGAVKNIAECFRSGEGLEDALLNDARILFQYDEFDTLLRMAQSDNGSGETIIGNVLSIYSKSDKYMVRRKIANNKYNQTNGQSTMCAHPSLTIYGTAVAARFYETISDRVATSGLYPRFIVIDAGIRTPTQRTRWHEPDQWLVYEIAKINGSTSESGSFKSEDSPDSVGEVTVVPMSKRAGEIMLEFADKCDRMANDDIADGVASNLWTRAEEKVEKVAMLFAISRAADQHIAPSIEECDVRLAISLAEYTTVNAVNLAESYRYENEFQKNRVKVLMCVERAGEGGIGRSELIRSTKLDKESLNMVIEALEAGGELESFTNDGDKTQFYRIPKE